MRCISKFSSWNLLCIFNIGQAEILKCITRSQITTYCWLSQMYSISNPYVACHRFKCIFGYWIQWNNINVGFYNLQNGCKHTKGSLWLINIGMFVSVHQTSDSRPWYEKVISLAINIISNNLSMPFEKVCFEKLIISMNNFKLKMLISMLISDLVCGSKWISKWSLMWLQRKSFF